MKEKFAKHKKKIIIGAITILSYFFAPAAVTIPILERLIEPDTIIQVHEEQVKDMLHDKK